MVLSKTAYYADFVVYALLVAALILSAAVGPDRTEQIKWLAAFIAGIALWTLLEYLLHRFVLHQIQPFGGPH